MGKWTSRKFLISIGAALLTILNTGLDLNIPPETFNYIWGIVIAYLAVEGGIDLARVVKE